MSHIEAPAPHCTGSKGSIELCIVPVERDIGDFTVRRVLPAPERKSVGPFVFFDHMGPADFPPGKGIQVRPHPHIGLATVTWLFEGEILHRDSLGYVQPITPGAVNFMTAGRGIVHSERAGPDIDRVSRLHGIQCWMALPDACEETEPRFVHHPAPTLPDLRFGDARVRIIIGTAFGETSPVEVLSPMLYLECLLPAGSRLDLPGDVTELAVYVVEGEVEFDNEVLPSGVMAVAAPGARMRLAATRDSRCMVLGGDPVGRRYVWWNFVSSSRARIETAKADWAAGRFGAVPGDDEFIPLPPP
ncbi:MAG TPA: pirin family protein [Woeseiaceae bacterium]|nr:pirin family protein [Woeseiaceae bacterium]